MIDPIYWRPGGDELRSPFERGDHERPIRITFDDSCTLEADAEELDAIRLLFELANLSEIDAISTLDSHLPQLTIEPFELGDTPVIIKVDSPSFKATTWLDGPAHISSELSHFYSREFLCEPERRASMRDYIVCLAHKKLGRDILVTTSKHLLNNKSHPLLKECNLRSPLEALKIIGLLLRSRNVYAIKASANGQYLLGRGLFYGVLSRHKLPALWPYFSVCVRSGDENLYLGQSILTRARRAFEARDSIGVQFYLAQDNSTQDVMMYHFDYLMLLLAGAFDAEAVVAHRVYGLTSPETHAGWQNRTFRKELRENGAMNLDKIMTSTRFCRFRDILLYLRNTIHNAALPSHAYSGAGSETSTWVRTPPSSTESVLESVSHLGLLDSWGVLKNPEEPVFEPYTLACRLVEISMDYLNQIAACTDIQRLLPDNHAEVEIMTGPPNKGTFKQDTRHRIDLLG